MSNPQQVVQWANVAGFQFPLGVIVAIDMSEYPHQTGQEVRGREKMEANRNITLYLIHSVQHTFEGDDADEFYKWWTELSTPKQVEGIRGIVRPT